MSFIAAPLHSSKLALCKNGERCVTTKNNIASDKFFLPGEVSTCHTANCTEQAVLMFLLLLYFFACIITCIHHRPDDQSACTNRSPGNPWHIPHSEADLHPEWDLYGVSQIR